MTNVEAVLPDTGERIHVGKGANGQEFLFQAHPDLGITTVAEWHAFIVACGARLETEDHTPLDLDTEWALLIERPVTYQRRTGRRMSVRSPRLVPAGTYTDWEGWRGQRGQLLTPTPFF